METQDKPRKNPFFKSSRGEAFKRIQAIGTRLKHRNNRFASPTC